MNKKKQAKTAFVSLLSRSASPDWTALEQKLPAQAFEPSAPTLYKKSYRRPIAAALCVLFIAVTILGVVVSDRQNTGALKTPVSTAVPDRKGLFGAKSPAGSQAESNTKSAMLSQSTAKLPMMPAEPDILNYNGRLYITNSVFGDKKTAKPGKHIGSISFSGSVPVYAVKGRPLSESICIQSTYNGSKNDLEYDYLCADSISAGGRRYQITSALTVCALGDAPGKKSAAGGYTMRWIYLFQSPSVRQATKAILKKKIASVPTGAVYAIEEIDSANAVCLNLGSKWFYLEKAGGYKGKTVDAVMADNGFAQTPLN
jgi:hypothetical protein